MKYHAELCVVTWNMTAAAIGLEQVNIDYLAWKVRQQDNKTGHLGKNFGGIRSILFSM